jgi:hypothetical protein
MSKRYFGLVKVCGGDTDTWLEAVAESTGRAFEDHEVLDQGGVTTVCCETKSEADKAVDIAGKMDLIASVERW